MFIPQENTKSNFGEYGLGIIPRNLENGKVVYEHNGTLTGYNAQMVFEPVSGDGIVVLTNSDKSYYMTYELMEKWGKYVLGSPVVDPAMHKIRFYTIICACVLMLAAIAFFINLIFKVKNKKSEFINLTKNKKKISISFLISSAMIICYYITFYSDIIFDKVFNLSNNYLFTFFPPSLTLINIDLLILTILINISLVYTKKIRNK